MQKAFRIVAIDNAGVDDGKDEDEAAAEDADGLKNSRTRARVTVT
jgi:hypothetical protein